MTKAIAHIDADIITYSVGFAAESDPVSFALHSVKKMIESIVANTGADDYVIYLSGEGNFRDQAATTLPYKGNRKSNKPKHYSAIREYLIDVHDAIVSFGCEADDLIGIACTAEDGNVNVCCTIDKDLNMIPGFHYNWKHDTLWEITPEDADAFFIEQMLTGDATDNIPGLYKFTGKKATKKVKERVKKDTFLDSWYELWDVYHEAFVEERERNGLPPIPLSDIDFVVMSTLFEIRDLLWIKRLQHDTAGDYLAECMELDVEIIAASSSNE